MRVGVDARKLHDFGIGTHIQGLLGALVALGTPEELIAYGPPDGIVPDALAPIAWRREPAPPYSLTGLWRLAGRARRDRLQLFHAPHYVCPPLLPCPAVVTVHDLIHLRFPAHRHRRLAPLYARVMLRLAVRRAARLIAVSASTRDDLVARLGAAPERIRVIPNGVAPGFRPAADPAVLATGLATLGVVPPYLLFVGNPLPHKNLPRLLEAFARLPHEVGRLVVAGVRSHLASEVGRAAERLGIGPRLILLAPVPADAMPVLYQGATALVCPSLWEGFGLPAAEAMACGTPVVAGATGALPEVVGDAGLLVDPTNVDAMRDAMYNLAVHAHLRATLRAAGLARARAFSWRRAAEATLSVYREALAGGREPSKADAGRASP
jgi:glycosyltransferase involved in cell wall biosynthesis